MKRVPRFTWTVALRTATACAVLALLWDVVLLAGAMRTHTSARVVPLRIGTVAPIAPRAADAVGLIQSARARQAFEPLGERPTIATTGVVIPQAAPMPVAQPRLIGTVVGGAESFVVMALADGSIKVVHVGDRAGGLRLRSVSAGGAVFDDINGDRVTLRSPTPGSEPQP